MYNMIVNIKMGKHWETFKLIVLRHNKIFTFKEKRKQHLTQFTLCILKWVVTYILDKAVD